MARPVRMLGNALPVLLVLMLTQSTASGQEKRPAYEPISALYQYLQENEKLEVAVRKKDREVIRNHAWNLWAGMMQPLSANDNSWPIWFSWQTTHQAFAQDAAPVPQMKTPRRIPSKANLLAAEIAKGKAVNVNTPQPQYPVPDDVIKAYPDGVKKNDDGSYSVRDGDYFVSNGDILIAVESLSQEAFDDIRNRKLYLQSTLQDKLEAGEKMIELPREYVSTKLMYWPVKADGVTPLPVWTENFPDFYTGYAGYELWNSVVAVDPTGQEEGAWTEVEYLYGVKTNEGADIPPQRKRANVVSIERFYHHKVTDEDWLMFTEADKAILNASSFWLYNEAFAPGDYIVTVASHINTKEIDSWTLQSVWWSRTPDLGPYAQNRPQLAEAKGPWDHYLMTDAYIDTPDAQGKLEKAVNPYIEGVTHPIATSCRNCHVRGGIGSTGYQTAQCSGLLSPLTPESACFDGALLTDYTWIIPDRAK